MAHRTLLFAAGAATRPDDTQDEAAELRAWDETLRRIESIIDKQECHHRGAIFDVVALIKNTEAFPALRDELLGLAVHDLSESTEYEYESTEAKGVVDFHWRFDNLKEAESVAEALLVLSARPELLLLRLLNCNDPDVSITYKNELDV